MHKQHLEKTTDERFDQNYGSTDSLKRSESKDLFTNIRHLPPAPFKKQAGNRSFSPGLLTRLKLQTRRRHELKQTKFNW